MDRICDDVLYRRDDRPFDPSGWDYASDEPADIASDHCKPFLRQTSRRLFSEVLLSVS